MGNSASGEFRSNRLVREARTTTSMAAYGDGGLSKEGKITFGWIISGAERREPLQHSQLVLVSVPALIENLVLNVETGWLDADTSSELDVGNKEQVVWVKLPLDYKAFENLALRKEGARQPVIFNNEMEKYIVVKACSPANILIPGARLWRSTTVTLGAQQANRITVLPNMRGIIARFDEVMLPPAQALVDAKVSKYVGEKPYALADIMVWTSEGVSETARRAIVVMPKPEVENCPTKPVSRSSRETPVA
jgi:hypothetical protein